MQFRVFDASFLKTAIALMALTWVVAGCGGGSGGSDPATELPPASDSNTITGQNGFGTASLSWIPAATRQDGSVLANLAGYTIHYGTSSGTYPNTIDVPNPGLVDYMVENLLPGTYYFVVTQYDIAGIESGYSNEVSKTIN